jgi:hypothetical protein
MKDVFYTLLVVWVIYRIVDALSTAKSKNNNERHQSNKVGETTVSYAPPDVNKKKYPEEGEYVDYEEIK